MRQPRLPKTSTGSQRFLQVPKVSQQLSEATRSVSRIPEITKTPKRLLEDPNRTERAPRGSRGLPELSVASRVMCFFFVMDYLSNAFALRGHFSKI
jgi:hypothetical protein